MSVGEKAADALVNAAKKKGHKVYLSAPEAAGGLGAVGQGLLPHAAPELSRRVVQALEHSLAALAHARKTAAASRKRQRQTQRRQRLATRRTAATSTHGPGGPAAQHKGPLRPQAQPAVPVATAAVADSTDQRVGEAAQTPADPAGHSADPSEAQPEAKRIKIDTDAHPSSTSLSDFAAVGVNAVTRAVERGKALVVLVCPATQPAVLVQHLPVLCKARRLPLIAVENLGAVLTRLLRCKTVSALAVLRTSASSESGPGGSNDTAKLVAQHPMAKVLEVVQPFMQPSVDDNALETSASATTLYKPLTLKKVPIVPKAAKQLRRGQITLPKRSLAKPEVTKALEKLGPLATRIVPFKSAATARQRQRRRLAALRQKRKVLIARKTALKKTGKKTPAVNKAASGADSRQLLAKAPASKMSQPATDQVLRRSSSAPLAKRVKHGPK